MPSKIDIISNALQLIGAESLNTLTDGTPRATAASNLYDPCYEALLTQHRWRFATKKVALSRLSAAPLNEWSYQFQIPSDCLIVNRVYPNIDYEIFEDRLFADQKTVEIDYIFKPSEEDLPPHFVHYLQHSLAAEYALPVTENTTLQDRYMATADLAGKKARHADSQSRTAQPIEHQPFISVRG